MDASLIAGGEPLRAPVEPPPAAERGKALPLRIAQAIARLLTSAQPWAMQLGSAERDLLAKIIGLADRRQPKTPISVSRHTLAERLGVSRPTIQRLLQRLQTLGWIERDQIKSRRWGFQRGTIALTDQALQTLFDDIDETDHVPPEVKTRSDHTRNADVSAVNHALLDTEQCIHRQPQGGFLDNPTLITPSQASQACAPSQRQDALAAGRWTPSIPQPLHGLLQVGISPAGVCALMREATRLGQRLEHIWDCVQSSVAKARNPFAYLRSLIQQPRDWQALRQQRNEATQRQQQISAEQAQQSDRMRWLREMDGKRLLDAQGRALIVMGSVIQVMRSDADGILRPAGVWPATAERIDTLRNGVASGEVRRPDAALCHNTAAPSHEKNVPAR